MTSNKKPQSSNSDPSGWQPIPERRTGRTVLGLSLAALALTAVFYRINSVIDNDRMFQTGPPAEAGPLPLDNTAGPGEQTENVVIRVGPGDTAWDLAGDLVEGGKDILPVVDDIMQAASEDGDSVLRIGEIITIDRP